MWRWLIIAAGAIVLLIVAGALALPYLVDLPRVRQLIAQEAGRALGRPVRFDSLSVSLFPLPAVEIQKLTVAEDPRFGPAPFLTADKIRLRLKLRKLLSGHVEFSEVRVERPNIRIVNDAKGENSLSTLGAAAPPPGSPRRSGDGARSAGAATIAISEIRIRNAALEYETRDRSNRSTGRYEVVGLSLDVNGLGSRTLTVSGSGTVRPGDMGLKVRAEVGPNGASSVLHSKVKGEVSIEANDLTPLSRAVLGDHPTLNGAFRGSLALSGTLGKLEGNGKIESASITAKAPRKGCPPPEVRSLTVERVSIPLVVAPGRAVSQPMALRVAGGTISLAGTLAWQPALTLTLREIAVEKVGLAPILSGYLCQGYAVDAPLGLKGDLSGPLAEGLFLKQLNGSGQLKIGAGKVTGPAAVSLFSALIQIGGVLSSGLSAESLSALAPPPSLSFEEISATYAIKDGTITTQDLTYLSRQLRVRGAGSYRLPDQYLDFDVVGETGRGKMRAKIVGPAQSPSIRPSTKSVKEVESALQRLLKGLAPR